MASPRGDCYPYSRTEACPFQGTVFTIRAGDRTRRPLRSWLMRCGIERPVRWFQGTPLLATCRFVGGRTDRKRSRLDASGPRMVALLRPRNRRLPNGANGGQRCIAKRVGTICCAPRIIGWSCVKLIIAPPTGADVNSDGNSFNHTDGPSSGAIARSRSPVAGGE